MKKLLVTGSSGLIGSESVSYFDAKGWEVHGVDNNMRRDFFGPDGDTTWNLKRIQSSTKNFHHHHLDIRNRPDVLDLLKTLRPDFIIHCAAQPSHDLAASRPFDDFDVNAVGTMNLLEATRLNVPDSVFCHMSTNKVYGDAPNELPLKELPTRWDFSDPAYFDGIAETFRIDRCKHSVFGASKVAADIMVQEYGRYFNMKDTACFRGGCLTGPAHSAAELHGFLAYLVKCCHTGRRYRVFGYKGKQVRDNIHSLDVSRALEAFYESPRCGEVYNLGGGRNNSVSILEAIARAEAATGKKMDFEYIDQNRIGDHICYISDLAKLHEHFPGWGITKSLDDIFTEIAAILKTDAMLKNIFKPRIKQSLETLLTDRIHYACGKNVMDGWLNVDGFDVSYPDGSINHALTGKIYHCDLSKPHPFPDEYFRFGYAEDFLEHLTQADSIVFLKECHRCFAPGGILRLSFPGLYGILCWHFKVKTRAEAEQGVRDAYTSWHHEHFYSPESISMVAKALGWRKTEVCPFGVSTHPELHNLETRPDQRELNLVVELTK